ncbi:MAG: phosphoribosylformylglycinamidine cyclo-ligase [Elusimicrobiota bacterium]
MCYKKSGVDINKANKLVSWIKKLSPKIGGFSGLYKLNELNKLNKPDIYLAASCDGVGTKLKIAQLLNKHDTVGIDLVAMNVNDVLCCGATPLFFLDYYACGKLNLKIAKDVIIGIKNGCEQARCVLLGGETAEMPGFYKGNEYDLAGFAVGIIDKEKIIDGTRIKNGDLIIGIPSSGLHSNGFSLIRKVFAEKEIKKFGNEFLKPTKIYVKEIQSAICNLQSAITGICHITGGGFYDNIVRILPENCRAVIRKNRWNVPEIFKVIQKKGNISDREMYRTFNMGIGMVMIIHEFTSSRVLELLKDSIIIGEIVKGKKGVEVV